MTKTVGSVKTEYCYEGNRLLWEKRGNASIVYTYDHTGINGFIYDMTQYLYVKNIQGDITQIYRISGEKEAEYRYDAFGNCETVYDINGIGSLNAIRYRGYYYDTETKLYYLINRYYDPELCRFISIDDISYLAPDTINGCNLYTYCGNNPVMNIDPTGCAPEWLKWLGIGAAILGAVLVIGAITILTAGVGTAVLAGATGAALHGAAVGALIGAGVGVAAGGVIGGAISDWSAEGVLIGMGIGFGGGALVGAVAGGAVGGLSYTPSGLSKSAINQAVKRTVSDSKRMSHIMQPKHGLPTSVKAVGKLMKKTLINGAVKPYGSSGIASSAFYSVMNSEVTYRIIGAAIAISDMWIR